MYIFTYSIPVANTWTSITIVVTGDTTGTWLTTNGTGIQLAFSYGSGTTYSTTAGAWVAGNFTSATGAVNLLGTSNATLYITGVQLEAGTIATPYEFNQYSAQLAQCYRYFTRTAVGGLWNVTGWITSPFPVAMRAAPTVTASAAFGQSSTPTVGSVTTDFVLINGSTIGFYASCNAEL